MPPPASALVRLNIDASDIRDDIGYFATPLTEVHDLLSEVDTVLTKPKAYAKKLDSIYDVLDDMEKACKSGRHIPEVGTAANSMGQVLAGINGFIGPTRDTLRHIQRDLKPLQDWIAKLQKPVDKAWSAVGTIEGPVERLAHVTQILRKHYNDCPPTGIEDCAADLGHHTHPVARGLNDAKDLANAELNKVEQPLRAAWNALSRLLDFSKFIERIYNMTGGLRKALSIIAKAIKKAVDYGVKAIERVLKWVPHMNEAYKRVKKMLKAVDDAIAKLRRKVTDFLFKPLRDMVNRIAEMVKEKLAKLPIIKKLKEAVAQVEEQANTVVTAIEKQAAPCRKHFDGSALPA